MCVMHMQDSDSLWCIDLLVLTVIVYCLLIVRTC